MSELLRLFTRAGKLMRAAADDAMSPHGVRVGQNLLLEVLWQDDGLTPGELAARLRITTPSVVNAATRMEAAGLVTRRRDESDARLVRLYLTEHGKSAQQPVQDARAALERRATAELTDAERTAVASALRKIIRTLDPEAGP